MARIRAMVDRLLRSGTRRQRALSGALAIGLLPVAVLVARAPGLPADRVEMAGGGAWLASAAQGFLTYVDGPSEEVVGWDQAPGARAGDALEVVQSGTSAYVLNSTRGTVARVDGGRYEAGPAIRFADAGGTLNAFVSPAGLYIVDSGRRLTSVTDPVTLQVRNRLSLAARPGPGQTVLDDAGRLWMVDRNGGLSWFDQGRGNVRPEVGDARSRLVLVGGRPVLVDPTRSRVGLLDSDGSVPSWSPCLNLRPGEESQLLGSATTNRVYAAVSSTGTLVVAGLDGDDCTLAVPVGERGDQFGPLVEAGEFVLVPNRSSGRTLVVDLSNRAVAADLDLKVRPGSRIELLAKDGLVFYNDLDGDKAGVIRFDGQRWQLGKTLLKYTKNNTGKGVLTPTGEGPAQRQPNPQPDRTTTPATDPGQQTTPEPTPSPNSDPPLPPVPDPVDPPPTAIEITDPPPAVAKPPVIRSLSWTPRTVVRGQPVTFTARVANPTGVTWKWSILDPATGTTLHQASTANTMRTTLPAGTAANLQVKLEIEGPAGATTPVIKPFTTTSSATPQIDSLTAAPGSPVQDEPVSFSAVESVAGTRGTWTWTITKAAGGARETGPTRKPARTPFTHTFTETGQYRVTLTVAYDGATDERTLNITVKPTNVTVRYEIGYAVRLYDDGNPINADIIGHTQTVTKEYPKGHRLTLTTDRSGPKAPEWHGACAGTTGTGPCRLTVNRNMTVSVYFVADVGSCTTDGGDRVLFRVNFPDDDNERFTAVLKVGDFTRQMTSPGAPDRASLEVNKSELPPTALEWEINVQDSQGPPFSATGTKCW